MKNFISSFALVLLSLTTNAQTAPFQVKIEPMSIPNLGGIQSYACGQNDGKWLIIGGRLDGLHRRQPFASFDAAGNNNQIIVIDPVNQQNWTTSLSSLPIGMQEQLSSTNMEFHQDGDYLYLLGGYGYSNTAGDHITYPNLSAVNVPEVINAVINGTPFTSHFRQIMDSSFAVTGGYLNQINSTYHLTGGQKFIGRYNPMGPDFGPGFIQEYTNADRKFTLIDDGTALIVTHLPEDFDAVNLHRRDYNVVPQILPNGEEGITAFSGVFQTNVDLPYLNSVTIDSIGHAVNNTFSQYYNHYHCAHIPLYSQSENEMHTLFFGGIAQFYDSSGILVQDNNVPFVKTISRVTRTSDGTMTEYKLPIEMPALLGAGSEFIPLENIPHYTNEVFNLDDFVNDTTLVGYIYGGISSTAANIFFTNTGTESTASSTIFKVYIIQNNVNETDELNAQSTSKLNLVIYPNPNKGKFTLQFNLAQTTPVTIKITDEIGNVMEETTLKNPEIGENKLNQRIKGLVNGGIYFITVTTLNESVTRKVIVEP